MSRNETQIIKYQNNYRLEPTNVFKLEIVEKLVKTIMNENFDNFTYETRESGRKCSETATEIQRKIQELMFDRYKIAVTVTIVEKSSQSIFSSAAFLWDSERDRYASYGFEGPTFYTYCSVFATYYE